MSFETGYIPEMFNDRNAYVLRPSETVYVSREEAPVLTTDEVFREFGIDAPLKLVISASSKKTFYLFDTRETPAGRVFPDRSNITFNADYLLVDDEFSPDSSRGFKGVRIGESWVEVGRNHLQDRFNYPDTVSRNHFALMADSEGIFILNRSRTNRTTLRRSLTKTRDEATLPTRSSQANEREQALGFEIGVYEQALKGEDRSLILGEAALFGVFDGMGGMANAALAAETAVDVVRESYSGSSNNNDEDLKTKTTRLKLTLQAASTAVSKVVPGGGTTGVVVQIVPAKDETSGLNAVWSAAGDSRLYHIRDHELRPVNFDEGAGSTLYNCLGFSHTVRQAGHFALQGGDKLILVSDGITGDYGAEILSDDEILSACEGIDARTAAQNLVRVSRKQDDKTASSLISKKRLL